MKLNVGLLVVVTLVLASGCAKQDWIDRTLVTVDVTGTWYGTPAGSGIVIGADEFSMELEQQGATIKGFMWSSRTGVSALAGPMGPSRAMCSTFGTREATSRVS